MVELKKETEKRILEAAKQVFIQKGMNASRMQEIADTAGINKSLLHYYFRTKERLFEAVLQEAIHGLYPSISEAMISSDVPFDEKIRVFASGFINMLFENPYVPGFIVIELNRDPTKVLSLFGNIIGVVRHFALPSLQDQINKQSQAGEIVDIKAQDLVINIISLCAFPFIAKPIVKEILFNGDETLFEEFLNGRADEVTRFVTKAIYIK